VQRFPDGGVGEELVGVESGDRPPAVESSEVPPALDADDSVEVPLDVPDEPPAGTVDPGVAPALPASVPETPDGL